MLPRPGSKKRFGGGSDGTKQFKGYLSTFHGLSRNHIEQYFRKTNYPVFLNIKHTKQVLSVEAIDEPVKKITCLAIGEPGGFIPEEQKYTFSETFEITILLSFITVPYPCERLPGKITNSIKLILEVESAIKVAEGEALAGTWNGEAEVISKYASNLMQLDNGQLKSIEAVALKLPLVDQPQNNTLPDFDTLRNKLNVSSLIELYNDTFDPIDEPAKLAAVKVRKLDDEYVNNVLKEGNFNKHTAVYIKKCFASVCL
ncbi:hypothetical protein PV328_001897 [Microctonus aethiopoides]|uniref:Ubiquitinyl hydrolase variant UBP zinc finger domain-containing protein n=1 Tax=Microctonus aethiopoides TaxID=144406 RepID=A0AA39KY28_9HYME|nr:hypothetical protein PV328_001897 [Microctonus aethiopoides]